MALLSSWMTVALMTVGSAEGGHPGGFTASATTHTRVAVVDVPAVSERYLKTNDLEAQFEVRRTRFNDDRKALRQKIERATRSLEEEFKPGTKERQERRKQLVMLEAELQWFMETKGREIEQDLANSLRIIFDDIQTVVRELAEERKIDVVLAADQLPSGSPNNTAQARQQIVLQKVLYWHPRVDLTEEVIRRLNAEYRAQRSEQKGLAQPPLSDEDQALSRPTLAPGSPSGP